MAYNIYISQTNELTANRVRQFIMPVRACIEPVTKQRIAKWDMGKDPEDVTEDEWIAWFMLAYQVDPRALDSLKKQIRAAAVFGMSITDADSRIGRMLDGMSVAIRRDRQDCVIREESTAIVKIIVDAIKPSTLHRAVTEHISLARNKALKNDVYRFVRWLREFAIGHARYVGYEEELKPSATHDAPKAAQGAKGASRPGVPLSRRQTVISSSTPAVTPEFPQGGCLKYKSPDHRVQNSPAVTKDEAIVLLKSHAKTLAQRRGDTTKGRKPQDGRLATIRNATVKSGRETLLTVVDGVVPVCASLLDSGQI
ncbi:hypothetical protein H310_11374 [Aphanomyces invadans]|uniref:Uncharacterized protein n=1 Tax=Aphanomyces invadans TaxID=157072 RepID=A0A024TN81_9STRA|nr:hypothetical protein H310_11374 [Aphanomyces invadans]ETV95091.1 hypothetical protein H310_11374 [Aphanomyces invadans]|eukprot:XP_008876264.1 hypothetical protein H310_11374 [Aphanomyces invadans]